MRKNKEQRFLDAVFDAFRDYEDYDEIAHEIIQIRKHLLDVRSFKRSSVYDQLSICMTVCTIVSATMTGNIKRFRPFKPDPSGGGAYDIRSGFRKPECIEIAAGIKKLI